MCKTLCEEKKVVKMVLQIKDDNLSGRSQMKNIRNNAQTTHITQLQNKKQLNLKRGKGLNRHFSEEDIHMTNSYRKKCSKSLIIREVQIKTTTRYLCTPIRLAIRKKKGKIICRQWYGKIGIFVHCWLECKIVQLGHSLAIPQKVTQTYYLAGAKLTVVFAIIFNLLNSNHFCINLILFLRNIWQQLK